MRSKASPPSPLGLPSRTRPWIKVCGVRTIQEIEWCAGWGATHIGVNAWPESPRFVDHGLRAGLIMAAREAGLVLVLVAPYANYLRAGRSDVAPEFLQMLSPPGDRERTALAEAGAGLVETRRMQTGSAPGPSWGDVMLLDAWAADVPGGSGRSFDWSLTREVRAPFVLAGGLGPVNVASAVAACRPAGVDAASGLESRPGVKDPMKIKDFCQAARAALKEISHES